ncbi:unnamed protein product, partial [Prunus brigantina]
KKTIERAFGRKLPKSFDDFEEKPVASGSIAQVRGASQQVKPIVVVCVFFGSVTCFKKISTYVVSDFLKASSEQGVYVAESAAAKNIKTSEGPFSDNMIIRNYTSSVSGSWEMCELIGIVFEVFLGCNRIYGDLNFPDNSAPFTFPEGLLSSEQGVYIAESAAAKNIKTSEGLFSDPHKEKKHIEVSGTRQIPIKTVPTSLDEVPSQRDAYGNKSMKVGSSSNANAGALVDDNNVGGSSYEETSPENCSVDHEADLKHSRENLLVSYILIAYFIHRDSLVHEEEQLHDEEKTGSDALQQAGEVLGQSAQSAMDVEDHGGSNHSAKVWPANGCTGERGTGRSAKKPGDSPIDVVDPSWELYVLIQRKTDQQGEIYNMLLGFTALLVMHALEKQLGASILVLPPYQHKGYGRYLLEVLNDVAISENVYDLTVEEPWDYFQHVRTCVDVLRLHKFDPIKHAVSSAVSQLKQGKLSKKTHTPRLMPDTRVIEDVRKSLKINKKQFLQCWEVFLYLGLDHVDSYMDDFVGIISNRMKEDLIGKYSGDWSQAGEAASTIQIDENQPNQEQLQQLVDERVKEIKSIAEKVFVQLSIIAEAS